MSVSMSPYCPSGKHTTGGATEVELCEQRLGLQFADVLEAVAAELARRVDDHGVNGGEGAADVVDTDGGERAAVSQGRGASGAAVDKQRGTHLWLR